MKDERLERIRKKDPIIATYPASTLLSASKTVDETYSEHALTHISIGNASDYLNNLKKWIQVNKGCVVGAIVGPNGYGKTSTAINFWKECEEARIVSIPPVSWENLNELFNGVYGWVKYKMEKRAPSFITRLDEIYRKYQRKSLDEICRTRNIPRDELKKMLESGELVLRYRPKEIIDYLDEMTDLTLSAEFEGLLVFLDELQVTLEEYPTRDKFMNDIFMLTNELLRRKGKYGIVFCMPTNTESLIADIRKDIIQRLQSCNLFIRADTLYDREFPSKLWEKYAHLYEFKEIKSNIIPGNTLDAIGQISSREDLGAGPRTVIDTFVQAVNYYGISKQPYTPLNLIDDYLAQKIAFVAGGKLVSAISSAVNIPFVQEKKERIDAIKLLSAYPRGCPINTVKSYNLENIIDELIKKLYGEVLIKTIEGYTLRRLLETELPVEYHFIRLAKDFINRYSEDKEHEDMARQAFMDNTIDNIFEKRRSNQIVGWSLKEEREINDQTVLRCLEGTFNPRFPLRKLNLIISSSEITPDILEHLDGITLIFHLDGNCGREHAGDIKFDEKLNNRIIIRLNLIQYSKEDLNIPYLPEFFPMDKVSPMFMLSLLDYLKGNSGSIPIHEIEGEMQVFKERLVNYSNQMVLSDSLRETSNISLKFVGGRLIGEIFNNICEKLYPGYETLMASPRWQHNFKSYLSALKDARINLRVARGSMTLQLLTEEIVNIFGTTSVLAFKTLAESIRQVLKIEELKEYGKVKFLYHPLEEEILDWIRSSTDRIRKKGNMLSCLLGVDVFGKGEKLGYTREEIAVAIELLKARKHVYFDTEKTKIYEFPVSIEERKELLMTKVSGLQKQIETLREIVSFDDSVYENEISGIIKKISGQIENEEDCEALQEEIHAQFRNINGFIQRKEGGITSDLGDTLQKIESTITGGIPRLLTQGVEAKVPWVADLNELRNMIVKKYNIGFTDFRKLGMSIEQLLGHRGTQRFGPETFLDFYSRNNELKSEYGRCDEELSAASSYFTKFGEWQRLLRDANTAFSNAQTCKGLYDYPVFLEKLEKIFDGIKLNFKEKKLEGLADYEIFSLEMEEVSKSLEQWQMKQRQTFLSKKENYEKRLQKIKVSEIMLRQNFDIFDPSGSFEELYGEVYDKTKEKLNDVNKDIKHFESEILYAIHILEQDLGHSKEEVGEIREKFQGIEKQFSIKMIKNFSEYDSFCSRIKDLNELIGNIRKNLRGVITKKAATKEEEEIVQLIKDRVGEDLKDVIMKFAEKNPERFNLSSILNLIESLFRKNQIIMKIFLRR